MTEHPKKYINDMTRKEIASYLTRRGHPPYRAGQICEWLYKKRAKSIEDMTNLPQDLRDHLEYLHLNTGNPGLVQGCLQPPSIPTDLVQRDPEPQVLIHDRVGRLFKARNNRRATSM